MKSKYIHKSHNVTVFMYHIVCPTKYRRVIFDDSVERVLKEICIEISNRYEIEFLEIGVDKDHVHFFVQAVPMYSPTKIVRTIKSVTAREIFKRVPEVKKQLWGGEFWSKGYYANSVGKYGSEDRISNYVRNQGNDYKKIHSQKSLESEQLKLWED